ncbi:MAG: protein kinase domain-containing protein [Rubripirellula sp.]
MNRSSSNPDSDPPPADSTPPKDSKERAASVTRGPEAETQAIPNPESDAEVAGNPARPGVREVKTQGGRFDETIAQEDANDSVSGGDFDADETPPNLGRYRIESLLGRGGMGSVYLAHDSQLDRRVALKVPKFEANANSKLVDRFYREARSAANLSHPNLCPVFDVGEFEGTHYIAMALIKGQPLSSYVNADKPLPERSVAGIVRKVALAMQEAHSSGIIHRDLKPANIMIDHRKEPIVMDFGLACPEDIGDDSRLTQDGALLGSPAYMSPEQLRGHQDAIGPCSDVYSLGVVLYELLSGRLPFGGTGSTVAMIGQILTEPAPALETLRPDLDPRLIKICSKAMAKSVDDRYRSMEDLATDLGRFLQGRGDSKVTEQATKTLQADVTRIQLNEQAKLAKTLCETGQLAAAAPILQQIIDNKDTSDTKAKAWAASTLSKVNSKIAESKSVTQAQPASSEENPFADLPDAVASPGFAPATGSANKRLRPARKKSASNVSKPIAIFAGVALVVVLLSVGAIAWMISSGDAGMSSDPIATPSEMTASVDASAETISPANLSENENATPGETAQSGRAEPFPPGPPGKPFGPGGLRRPNFAERILERFDNNRDGVIDSTEVPPHERARIFEVDRDRNNELTLEELRALDPLDWPPPKEFGERRGFSGDRGDQAFEGRRPGNRQRDGGRGPNEDGQFDERRGAFRGGGPARNGEGGGRFRPQGPGAGSADEEALD